MNSIQAPHGADTEYQAMQVTMRAILIGAALLIGAAGCVRRTISITTEPPNARVFLNDQEIGRSPATTDFLWYGDYDVAIRKEGYQTLQTSWKVKAPWYQIIPIDFFAEVLWPGRLHDHHERHFTLEPAQPADPQELLGRAEQLRQEAVGLQK